MQIPKHIARAFGEDIVLEHSFGREYPELESGALGQYKLAIHCGGCMIDAQKMRARWGGAELWGCMIDAQKMRARCKGGRAVGLHDRISRRGPGFPLARAHLFCPPCFMQDLGHGGGGRACHQLWLVPVVRALARCPDAGHGALGSVHGDLRPAHLSTSGWTSEASGVLAARSRGTREQLLHQI